ncbi:MAG: response regulator [Polyangiales bacterium]
MKRDQVGRGRESLSKGLRRERILYVEDDDDNWEIAELRLAKRYDLVRARTDEQACRFLREQHQDIDLILMDIELRGSELNGIELTELLRGNTLPERSLLPSYARHLPPVGKPVIFVTAHGARYTSVKLMLSGADKVISKPVDFADLQIALRELLVSRSLKG